jgi:RHS repeat-associated protein
VVKDQSTSTLYLPSETLTANGTTVSGTRYYSHDGKVIAARTSSSAVSWLLPDPQGTASTAVDANSQALTRRYYTPYGVELGTPPPSWPGNRGYVDGKTDDLTNLVDLGAREYNPALPVFISPDAILTPNDPTDLNPYSYAFNNPVTREDQAGLCPNPNLCPNQTAWATGGSSGGATTSGGTTTYTPPPPVQLGTVLFPANYPYLGRIQTIYNMLLPAGGANRSSPFSQYHALYMTCQDAWAHCGGTLQTALALAGPLGTALFPGTARSPQKATEAVYINSTQISSRTGGLGALAAAAGAAIPLGRGSTGRTEPVNLREQLAMEEAQSGSESAGQIERITMNDPRWPSAEGWVKMRQNVNDVEIHYLLNTETEEVDDFKFITPPGYPDPWSFAPLSITGPGGEW